MRRRRYSINVCAQKRVKEMLWKASVLAYNGKTYIAVVHAALWVIALILAWVSKSEIDDYWKALAQDPTYGTILIEEKKALTLLYALFTTLLPALAVIHAFLLNNEYWFEPVVSGLLFGFVFFDLALGSALIGDSIVSDKFALHTFGLFFTAAAAGMVTTFYPKFLGGDNNGLV